MMETTAKPWSTLEGLTEGVAATTEVSIRQRAALMLERVTFYGLLSLLPLAAIPYGTVQPWWVALFNSLVFVFCSFRIVEAMLRRDFKICGLSILFPTLALCAFAASQTVQIGFLSSTDPHETWRFAFRVLAFAVAGESLLRYTSTRRRFELLVGVVIAVGVLSAVFGIARSVAQGSTGNFLLPDLSKGQGFGQFVNYNHFALLMEMCLGLLVGLTLGVKRSRGRFLPFIGLGLLVWAALVSSNSRGGLVGMLGLILFAAIVHASLVMRRRWQQRDASDLGPASAVLKLGTSAVLGVVLCTVIILVTALGVLWVGGDPVMKRLERSSGQWTDVSDNVQRRKEIWRDTWSLFKADPIAGSGFGAYSTAITAFITSGAGDYSLDQAHNDYLEVLASGGLIGAAIVTWFLIALALKATRRLNSKDAFDYGTCLGALAGLSAVMIHGFFDFGLHVTANAATFTFLIVIATASYAAPQKTGLKRRKSLLRQ